MTELHLFILWQNARYKEEEILKDMAKHFTILKQYAITWTPELASSNFTRFYGVNLPPKSSKEKECGTGEFLLCVVRDEHPVYEERKTSHGLEKVNANMFDAKERYRSWTGGGHKIHGSNNEKETNHDLTLLIGKNVTDFLSGDAGSCTYETLQRNIEGANGWVSIEHLFYVLNNTVSYVVLRGYSNLLPKFHSDFEDTDILTSEYDNLWKIVNGTTRYDHVRPKSIVVISDKTYLLDIWDSQKKYYDPIWFQTMLEYACQNGQIRVLDEENDFYCLLYHCLTNKGFIDVKYAEKLQSYKKKFAIKDDDWAKVLVDWMVAHNYDIIKHTDSSCGFDLSNQIIYDYATRFGKNIQMHSCSVKDIRTGEDISWTCRVYKKENSYVKAGTPWLIENECRFLQILGEEPNFPKLISYGNEGSFKWIEISPIDGMELFSNKWGISICDIRRYATHLLTQITKIYDKGILHRDIQPNNILVNKKGIVSIIDFAFAIDYRDDRDFCCPWNLGIGYSPDEMYSDFYNLAEIFSYRYGSMPFVKHFTAELKKIDWAHYQDADYVHKQIDNAKHALHKRYTCKDWIEFALCKYRIRKYIKHPKKFRRRIAPLWERPYEECSEFGKKIMRKIKKILKKIYER